MTLITDVRLRRVLDSRGDATVEADVRTESGGFGRGIAPSGASTGEFEAVELPPEEAVAAAREHAVPRLVGEVHAGNQREVDSVLRGADGTENFSEIGANSAVAVSVAAAKAAADVLGAPLFHHLGGTFRGETPVPLGNVIGGGAHAADSTDFQEFLAVPVGAPSAVDAAFANAAVHETVGDLLRERGHDPNKGDEGAWAAPLSDATALEVLTEATDRVADEVGFEIGTGVDVAAAELYDGEAYRHTNRVRLEAEQIEYVADLVEEYDLVYVEDPLDEADFEAYAELTERVGDRTVVCGDDLFVTDADRVRRGVEAGAANAVLVKPNQVGTLSGAVDAVDAAREAGYTPVVSHRSGETEDTTIAHLAVAVGAPYLKTGAVGGERTAKLNELIRIEADAA
ncbi:phosphopyruvate hydratase [Halobacteriales archaeon SW_7_71_33]|nr:MAG: phosphopyruvate hydratase [Halobacteriales archaeon SW_7_71_33]